MGFNMEKLFFKLISWLLKGLYNFFYTLGEIFWQALFFKKTPY